MPFDTETEHKSIGDLLWALRNAHLSGESTRAHDDAKNRTIGFVSVPTFAPQDEEHHYVKLTTAKTVKKEAKWVYDNLLDNQGTNLLLKQKDRAKLFGSGSTASMKFPHPLRHIPQITPQQQKTAGKRIKNFVRGLGPDDPDLKEAWELLQDCGGSMAKENLPLADTLIAGGWAEEGGYDHLARRLVVLS